MPRPICILSIRAEKRKAGAIMLSFVQQTQAPVPGCWLRFGNRDKYELGAWSNHLEFDVGTHKSKNAFEIWSRWVFREQSLGEGLEVIQGHTEEAEEGSLESKFKETYRAAMYSSRVLTVNLYNLKLKILLQSSLKAHFLSVVKKTKCPLYCPQLLVLWGSNSPHHTVQGMIPFICLTFTFWWEEQALFSPGSQNVKCIVNCVSQLYTKARVVHKSPQRNTNVPSIFQLFFFLMSSLKG